MRLSSPVQARATVSYGGRFSERRCERRQTLPVFPGQLRPERHAQTVLLQRRFPALAPAAEISPTASLLARQVDLDRAGGGPHYTYELTLARGGATGDTGALWQLARYTHGRSVPP